MNKNWEDRFPEHFVVVDTRTSSDPVELELLPEGVAPCDLPFAVYARMDARFTDRASAIQDSVAMVVKKLRLASNQSRAELAERSGLSESFICGLEEGTVEGLALFELQKLAQGLGLRAAQLYVCIELERWLPI